jgi:Domain of unknown function (DUF5069)
MDQIEPLISSNVAGPLGILHLPRLWLKILLHACGRLPDGYRHGVGGFDELLCERFGIDRDAFVSFIQTEKPDYQRTERWVVEHAKDLSPQTVAAFNLRIRTTNMRDETAAERRARFNIDDATFANAIALNNLDDWAGIHERLARAHSE